MNNVQKRYMMKEVNKCLVLEQANKIDEVLKVLRAENEETYADEINYLEIVKNNLEQSCN